MIKNLSSRLLACVGSVLTGLVLHSSAYAVPIHDLAITKTFIGSDTVVVGDVRVFTISVTNNGPDVADGVSVLDTFDAGFDFAGFISISQGIGIFMSDEITASFGTLMSGAMATLSFGLSIVDGAGTTLTNSAEISGFGNGTDPDLSNNTAVASVRVLQVPEPATLALLGIALAGLGFSRRRRASK